MIAMIFGMGATEILLICGIALLVLGPKKLPEGLPEPPRDPKARKHPFEEAPRDPQGTKTSVFELMPTAPRALL